MKTVINAFQLMTLIPLRGGSERISAAVLIWFPFVGFVLGGTAWLVTFSWSGQWPEGAAVVSLIILAALTGGFHLDGLADMADGFSASYDKQRVLEIMKDSRTGAFGVIALIILLLTKFVALAELFEQGKALWVIGCVMLGRFVIVDQAVCMQYARSYGTGAIIVEDAKWKHWFLALLITLVPLFLLYQWKGVVLLVGALALAAVLRHWFNKVLNGVTGDLLGATCELTETILLFCLIFSN